MKLDFSVVLLDIDDEEMTQPVFKSVQAKDKDGNPDFHLPDPEDDEDEEPIPVLIKVLKCTEKVTLGMVVCSALTVDKEGEKLNGRLKQDLRDLAYEINQAEKKKEPIEVDDDDLKRIRDRVGKIHTISYVGAARPFLVTTDKKTEGKKKKKNS